MLGVSVSLGDAPSRIDPATVGLLCSVLIAIGTLAYIFLPLVFAHHQHPAQPHRSPLGYLLIVSVMVIGFAMSTALAFNVGSGGTTVLSVCPTPTLIPNNSGHGGPTGSRHPRYAPLITNALTKGAPIPTATPAHCIAPTATATATATAIPTDTATPKPTPTTPQTTSPSPGMSPVHLPMTCTDSDCSAAYKGVELTSAQTSPPQDGQSILTILFTATCASSQPSSCQNDKLTPSIVLGSVTDYGKNTSVSAPDAHGVFTVTTTFRLTLQPGANYTATLPLHLSQPQPKDCSFTTSSFVPPPPPAA
jgi:hypothetical protein